MEEAAAAGRKKRFTGVVRKKGEGKFGAQIKHPVTKTILWLGTYSSPEVAACAYDLAARELKGAMAKHNFPYPPPARLVKEVMAARRHRSQGHDEPLFQVVSLPPDPTAPPPPAPKLVVYFPFTFQAPAGDPPPVPAYPFLHMPRPPRTRKPIMLPAPESRPPIQPIKFVARAESCLSSSMEPVGASSSRRLVFKKPKLLSMIPSAPTEGTGDNFTKPWYLR